MSRLVSRILLTVFMLPAGTLVFILAFLFADTALQVGRDALSFLFAGTIAWLFVGAYWILLWRGAVHWDRARISLTCAAVGVALIAATIL